MKIYYFPNEPALEEAELLAPFPLLMLILLEMLIEPVPPPSPLGDPKPGCWNPPWFLGPPWLNCGRLNPPGGGNGGRGWKPPPKEPPRTPAWAFA